MLVTWRLGPRLARKCRPTARLADASGGRPRYVACWTTLVGGQVPPKKQGCQMIELVPYHSVNAVSLGSSVDHAVKMFGPPDAQCVLRSGNLRATYTCFTLIFSKRSLRLQECVVRFGAPVRIAGVEFDWSLAAMEKLCAEDGDPREYFGTVLLFNRGLSMSGLAEGAESDRTVSIFLEDVWAPVRAEMAPLPLSSASP